MTRRDVSRVTRALAVYLLATAGTAMLFAIGFQLIWLRLPNAPPTIVLPGMALPGALSLRVNSYSANGITIEGSALLVFCAPAYSFNAMSSRSSIMQL
jgi:hypothetical protein